MYVSVVFNFQLIFSVNLSRVYLELRLRLESRLDEKGHQGHDTGSPSVRAPVRQFGVVQQIDVYPSVCHPAGKITQRQIVQGLRRQTSGIASRDSGGEHWQALEAVGAASLGPLESQPKLYACAVSFLLHIDMRLLHGSSLSGTNTIDTHLFVQSLGFLQPVNKGSRVAGVKVFLSRPSQARVDTRVQCEH